MLLTHKNVEIYDKISVVITRVNNSYVLVNVVENGQPFFSLFVHKRLNK